MNRNVRRTGKAVVAVLLDHINWIALDCETTGLDPEWDRVVEVAAILFRGRRERKRFVSLVKADIPIPIEAWRVHGITSDDIANAPTWAEVLTQLRQFISHDAIVVAHHVAFDRAFLRGIPDAAFVDTGAPIAYRWVCTRTLAKRLLPEAAERSLSALRDYCRIEIPEYTRPHRALDDAMVVGALFQQLADVYENWQPIHLQSVRQFIAAGQEPLP